MPAARHRSLRPLSSGLTSRQRHVVELALVALGYLVLTRLTLETKVLDGGVVALWPAAGFALAALLKRGNAVWPGLLVGAWAGKLMGAAELAGAFGSAVAATLGALVAATIVRRLVPDLNLYRLQGLLMLIAAAACGAVVSALVGVTSVWAEGTLVWRSWGDGFLLWALGDLEGTLILAPLLLASGKIRGAFDPRAFLRAACAVGALLALTIVLFAQPDGQLWVLMPGCIWIAMRRGVYSALTASLGIALIAVAATDAGRGPFAHGTEFDLIRALLFTILSSGMLLIVVSVTGERRRALAAIRRISAEDAALRRVATAVARTVSLDEICVRTGEEIVSLLGVDAGLVAQFGEDPGRARIAGEWGAYPDEPGPDGQVPLRVDGALARVRATGAPVRIDERRDERLSALPFTQRVAAPVEVDGRIWGALLACSTSSDRIDLDAERRLERFAELIGLALANAEARARLIDEASVDALTGLLNHRAFHERLADHTALARRGSPVSVVVFDVDRFKEFNDGFGHEAGDDLLRHAARRLRSATRTGETLARIGGDEFGLLVSGDREEAFAAAERIRAAAAADGSEITLSAGVADSTLSADPKQLLAFADGALYWSKMHGRNATCAYDPGVVQELSADERVERLERNKALGAVRALAKAIDAKDAATTRHSERVARLAVQLAQARGWNAADVARLRDAGLVHDVGKIGVADAILTKPGPLTAEEYDAVKRHSALSARIVAEVLDEEQTAWVRGHHERHDGRGYPDGVAGEALSEGARLLALADAWDAMTGARPYSDPMAPADALREVLDCTGTQFHPDAVQALEQVYAATYAAPAPLA